MSRRDALGRPREFPKASVLLLVVLACLAAYPGVRRHQEERRLAAAASAVAGVHDEVSCQGLGGALVETGAEAGFVRWGADGRPEHVAHIMWDQCRDLRSYLRSGKGHPTAAQITAVHVLTHEAVHTSGVTSESRTECMALQRDARTAQLLGASERAAKALAWLYWRTDYPNMPDDYRDAACVPGGSLDERLPTSPWVAGP